MKKEQLDKTWIPLSRVSMYDKDVVNNALNKVFFISVFVIVIIVLIILWTFKII